MPSSPRQNLDAQLADFDELITARNAICPNGAGRPAKRRGAAVIRGAVMLLAAAFEAYVEDVYDLAVDRIFVAATPEQRKALKKQTSGRLNNADVDKVNFLFFHVGIPWIMGHRKMHWQKFGNDAVQKTLKRLVETRNSNAHGKPKAVRKPTAVAWRGFVARLADRIDEVVADRVEEKTSVRPW